MSLAQVFTRGCVGVDAPEVIVEIHLGGGLPAMSIVGLPEAAVREARDRVKAALLNALFEFPQRRITISLAPAELPKEGSRFDLPIALGILVASGQLPGTLLNQYEFIGELSLSGVLNPVRGVLPAAIEAGRAGRGLVVPQGNAAESALADGRNCLQASSLLEVVGWMHDRSKLKPVCRGPEPEEQRTADLADVIGQQRARRALEVAAAGGHNILFTGSPGTGKTMLASRLPGLLPPMRDDEALEAAAIASVSQQGLDLSRWRVRPFRAPHHTVSAIALVGGGSRPRPGEISLAHNGVLFLDELPEFNRHALEVLREPMESGHIVISRALRSETYPARFQLVAAMNPCPCGQLGDASGLCHCSADQVSRYRGRISGPLLDRIDLHIEVSRPKSFVLQHDGPAPESSAQVRSRVQAARLIQQQRAGRTNAQLEATDLKAFCRISAPDRKLLAEASKQHALSPRACIRIMKVARTLADLEAETNIGTTHVAEAISYRNCGAMRT
ncbi:MAG TPA: YifB family Mg chelatase-like AAA ATPase [Xanthomonadales bacterium]|nr:YifB family Mg chelatase-like AAA ATPase [Xanthomonadales bacterium]